MRPLRGTIGRIVVATPSPYTITAVQAAFRAHTGVELFRVESATTDQLTTLGTRPMLTKRFGSFELYAIKPRFARDARVDAPASDPPRAPLTPRGRISLRLRPQRLSGADIGDDREPRRLPRPQR